MRGSTAKSGLNLVIAGVVAVIVTTFYHEQAATVARLSAAAETQLVFYGLFAGGVCGCVGILVTVAGILRDPLHREERSLVPTLVILVGAIVLFFFLLYSSFHAVAPPTPRPGETVTI